MRLIRICGSALLVSIAITCAGQPARAQPAPTCPSPELRRALAEIGAAANANRLAEFFRLQVLALPRMSQECGFSEARTREILLPYLVGLLDLGRLSDVERFAGEALGASARGEEAREFRLSLLLLRIRAAIMRRNARDVETHYAAYEQAREGVADPPALAADVNWVRRCRQRNAIADACRDREKTILYRHFSFEDGSAGSVLAGQCPTGQVIFPDALISPGAPFQIIERPARALNAACAHEPSIARLAERWWTAIERGDAAALEIGPRLALELDAWAEELDGFDRDNPVTRLQVRGLAFYVRHTDRRLRCGRCIAYPPDEMRRRDQEKAALRPYLEAALPGILRGDEGFLRTDTVGLAGFLVSQASWMGDAAQAELVWQLIGRSFPDRETAAHIPLEEVRSRLGSREALITVLHPADGVGVILMARRTGSFILRELDAAATLARGVGGLLLEAGSRPPGGTGFPLYGARLLYQQYVCPVEAWGPNEAAPTELVFVPDSAMERVPLPLLVRPIAGCVNAAVRLDQAYREGRAGELASARWLGDDYAFRIMPFAAVDRAGTESARTAYLGVGGARSSRRVVDIAAPPLSRIEQQSDYAASMPPLRGTVAELVAVAENLGSLDATWLVGEEATEANVRRAVARPNRIVHFATHALDPASDMRVIEPLLVLTRPASGGFDPQNDGVLGSSEVSRLRVAGATIILSACRTAAPRPGLGTGLFSGLVQSFFEAGATQAMATYWPIDDEAAAMLVPEVARMAVRGELAVAVRDAQRAFRRGATGPRARLRHPYYWGAFVAVSPNLRGTVAR